MKRKRDFIEKWGLFLIILLSLAPLFSLVKPGMFVAHDSQAHIVRIASFYQSLSEGNIFPRWSHILNSGYGHPIFMFLYPLPSYLASGFHFLGWNFASSIKLVLASAYLSAGVFMFLWLKRHFSAPAALVGSTIFQLAPYRFVNLYVRNALGEHTAYLFIPLSLLAIHHLVEKTNNRKVGLVALAIAGLILAHNAVSLMFLPFLALYSLILILGKTPKRGSMMSSIAALLIAFLLSAFFWLTSVIYGLSLNLYL